MYFELEDFRPDTPRAPSVISRREGVLLSIIAHLIAVVVYLVLPKGFFDTIPVQPFSPPEHEQIKFVAIQPLKDRPAPPKPNADQSDMDRQAATKIVPPKPQDTTPFSRGNTPDKIEGGQPQKDERAKGPDTQQPAAPPSPNMTMVPDLAAKVMNDAQNAQRPAPSGSLGDRLRNLSSVLQNQNFDNPNGGQAQQNADIQFDSKGIDFGPWLRRFRAQVMSNWFVPENAMFQHGHVVLQFYVHRDGSITDLVVYQASDIDSFTKSSFNAMKLTQQQKTMPLPTDYPADKVLFTVTFFYNERFPGER